MIETRDLRVDYDGLTAVSDVNLSVPAGEVFGLIGPNGAGKTSTIRVLATLLRPTYGEVRIDGIDAAEDPRAVHRVLGYMPDMAPVYDDLRCWEFLDLFAAAYFVARKGRRARVEECIDLAQLREKRDAMAGTLSRGMKQRLLLAKTLLHDPSVLLLDEPASGLDPMARIELRELLKGLGRRGKTILISSHILTELSEFCGSVGIMHAGRLVVSGRIETILAELRRSRRVVVEVVGEAEAVARRLEAQEGVLEVERIDGRVEFAFAGGDEELAGVLRSLVEGGAAVRGFYERRGGVEEIMVSLGRGR